MPLYAEIYVNRQHLGTVNIGRMEGGTEPDDLNTYRAVISEGLQFDWYGDDAVEYEHRYGDGALVCVRKGIEALEAAKKTRLPK